MRVRPAGCALFVSGNNLRHIDNRIFVFHFVVHPKDQHTKVEDSEFPLSFTCPRRLQAVTTSIGCAESKQAGSFWRDHGSIEKETKCAAS
jgi:hypothetical protein